MANLIPFHGVLYDPEAVGDIREVVAPPYDVIDAEYQRALHSRHPQNVIRLELGLDQPDDGPSQNRYSRAAGFLQEWLASGKLRRDPHPAIYLYTIEYRVPPGRSGTATRVLKGFLSAVELEEFGTGRIFPHENTRPSAKTDRLKLMEACRANFSPIFSLYSDPEGGILRFLEKSVDTDKPRIDSRDDSGFGHRLWVIRDQAVLEEVCAALKPKPLFIADGHHRYETALTYRRLRREQMNAPQPIGSQPYDHVLMLFSSLEDPGLTVLPTHRVLRTPVPTAWDITNILREGFEIREFPFGSKTERRTRQRFIQALRERGHLGTAFGLARRGASAYLLLDLRSSHRPGSTVPAQDRLDVSILQNRVLNKLCPSETDQESIFYTKDDDEALDLVSQGTAEAALLLNPTKVEEIRAVAAAGERMPHKSTYFYPKPLTGLVMNVMES